MWQIEAPARGRARRTRTVMARYETKETIAAGAPGRKIRWAARRERGYRLSMRRALVSIRLATWEAPAV